MPENIDMLRLNILKNTPENIELLYWGDIVVIDIQLLYLDDAI